MPLYEIVKADGTREKVEAEESRQFGGALFLGSSLLRLSEYVYHPGTWLEVWRREGSSE